MDTLILKSNKTFTEDRKDLPTRTKGAQESYYSMFESPCPEEEYSERVMELKDEQEHLCLAIGYLKAKLPENYDSGNSNTTDLYRSLHTQFEMSNSNTQKYKLFNRLVDDFLTSSGKTVSSHEYHQSELEIYRDIKGLGKSNRFKGYLELCDEEDNIQSREDHSNETEMKKKQMFQVLDYLDKKLTEYNEGNETDTTNLKRSLQQLHEYNKSNELEIVSVDSLVQEFLLKKTERSSGYYLSAVEVYTGISQHLAGSRFYLALDRIKCFKREGYLWKNICWDNEVYQDRKRIAEDQEHDQEHLCSAIGYLKGKLLELHERDDSDTTNSDVSSHKQYDMGDSISEKDDLFERLVREFLTSSRKTDSTVEYHQLKTEIFRDIEGLGNSFWFARRKHIHITCAEIQSIKDSSNVIEKKKGEMREILGYFKDKFLKHPGFNESVIKKKFQEFKKMNEANELGIESVDDFVESFRALPGKADEIYKSAVEVYTDINKLVPGSTFYWDLKVRIDYSRWLAYLSKAFPEEFSEMYNDDEKLLCERIGDLDGNKLLQMAEKLLKLSNKNNDSYDFFEEAIKVYTELNGLVDCPPMDGICSEKIIHYHEKLLNLAIEESTGPNPFLMKHLINYQNALTAYSNCCELLDITSGVAREFLNVLSFDFIDKPIDKHDVQSEWASYIYERYKEPNIKILDKIDRLVDIRPSKTGDHYESEIKEDKQDRLMSILTGEGFACIDYDVKNSMKPEDSYHQYIFINQNHLQIRIKLYNEVKNKHPKFTIGFYEDDPIDRQKDGPKLNIMKVPRGKEFEEDFVCTNQGNEIIKYANGCLTPAFYADNSDVGWDLTRAISDTQIKEIYKKITGKIKSYKEKCVNIKKYLVDHKSQHFGDEVIGKILKNREFLHGKNLEKQSVKDQIKEVLESCKKNVVDEPGQSPDSTKQIERIISEIMVMEEDLVRDGNKILEDAKKYMVLEDGKKYKGNGVSFDVVSGSLKLQKTTLNEQDIKNQIENVLIESYKKVVMDPAHLSLNIDSDTMKEELDKIHEESECGNEENNKSSLTRFSMFKHKDPKPKVKSLHSDYEKIEVKTRYNGDETTTIYERNNKKLRDLTSQQGPKGMC